MNIDHAIPVSQQQLNVALLEKQASRFFLLRFGFVTALLGMFAGYAFYSWGTAFVYATLYGNLLSTVSSFVSYLVMESAYNHKNSGFMGIALGSIIMRMFNLLFAFAIGLYAIQFNSTGMVVGMFLSYFSYLVVEIAYLHSKAFLLED